MKGIPLKKPSLRRCFNFPLTATYDKYASFLENFAPCIPGFLSGIMFQGFCSVIKRGERLWKQRTSYTLDSELLFKDRAKKEQEALDSRIQEKLKETIREMGLVTKEDFEELKTIIKKA
jgi:hypothetical protein